jgi:hypothetical protein
MQYQTFKSPLLNQMLSSVGTQVSNDIAALRRIALNTLKACPEIFPMLEDEDPLYVLYSDALAPMLLESGLDNWWEVEWLAFDENKVLRADRPLRAQVPRYTLTEQQELALRMRHLADLVWQEFKSSNTPLKTADGREFLVFEEHTVGYILERARRLAKVMDAFRIATPAAASTPDTPVRQPRAKFR